LGGIKLEIAITGGSGFIGKWLIRRLGPEYRLRVLGRNRDGEIEIDGYAYKYVWTDYSGERLPEQLKGCEAVVHLAARRPRGQEDAFAEFIENVSISANLFEACRLLGIKNVVNISSISVYSHENPLPWSEDQLIQPLNVYGVCKAAVENIGHVYTFSHKIRVKSLRLAQVVGLGEREGFMLTEFIKRASRKETLFVHGEGVGRREYVYVKDVVDAIHAALMKSGLAGVFNIGSGENISHCELAEMINEVFDNKENVRFLPDYSDDKAIKVMNLSKTRSILDWRAKWPIREAFVDMRKSLNENIMDVVEAGE
jgi:UDP-glucose 4-epimerase